MERRDAQQREEYMIEEECEKKEKGLERWVDHDVMPEDETPEKIFLNDTLPVAQDRPKLLLTLPLPRLGDYEDMLGSKPTPVRKKKIKEQNEEKIMKKAKLVVKEHNMDTATRQWNDTASITCQRAP
jgi:hypothetical protein